MTFKNQFKFKLNTAAKAGLISGVSALALSNGIAFSALAQDAKDSGEAFQLEEIVVTATKRSESIQDVPLAMSAYDASFVQRMNFDDVKDLIRFTPGFAGNTQDSFIDYVNVRGISTNDFGVGTDPSVAFFKNGFYQGRNGAVVTSTFDMERAEVLRGPQGFLFGRSAIAGAVSTHTAKPQFEEVQGYIDIGLGERGIAEYQGALDLPVSEEMAFRLASYASTEDGFVENRLFPERNARGGHDKYAARLTTMVKKEKWDLMTVLEFEERRQDGTTYFPIPGNETSPQLQVLFPSRDFSDFNGKREFTGDERLGNEDNGTIFSATMTLNYFMDGMTLTSLTGYKKHDYQYAEDFDGTPVPLNNYSQKQNGEYFEQELRLVGDTDGDLDWYAGVSYFKEDIDAVFSQQANENAICGFYYYYYYGVKNCKSLFEYWEYPEFNVNSTQGLLERNRAIGSYTGWSAFADLTYAIDEAWDVSLGLRYIKETKDFSMRAFPVNSDLGPWYAIGFTTSGFISDSRSWDAVTPRFNLRYRPNDDFTAYFSATRGYKAGGFNTFGANLIDENENFVADQGSTPQSFEAESVWSYEMGMKATMLDKRVNMDLSIYKYDYKDMQIVVYDPTAFVRNVGEVSSYGAEASMQAIVTENLDIFAGLSYNSNEISGAETIEPGSTGNSLPGMPEFTAMGVVRYHTPVKGGEMSLSLDFRAQTETYGGLANAAVGTNAGWSEFNLRASFENDEGWSVRFYVENLFDKIYFNGSEEATDFIPAHYFGISRPRTVGVRFSYPIGN